MVLQCLFVAAEAYPENYRDQQTARCRLQYQKGWQLDLGFLQMGFGLQTEVQKLEMDFVYLLHYSRSLAVALQILPRSSPCLPKLATWKPDPRLKGQRLQQVGRLHFVGYWAQEENLLMLLMQLLQVEYTDQILQMKHLYWDLAAAG